MNHQKLLMLAAAAASSVTTLMVLLRKRRTRRRLWSREWLKRRSEGKGVLNMLNDELLREDPPSYRNFLRLTNEQFEHLLNKIEGDISKQNTFMRESISARSRLEVTLRFLATGESYRSLMYSTRIHESTISRFIPEVCKAISQALKSYIKMPTTIKDWKNIAEDFEKFWQFPLCIGALDGRHINFRAPLSDGSYYYNYKGHHSIVLLGLADAHYRFIYANIGVNGRVSDGGVFRECALAKAIKNKEVNFPPKQTLPGRKTKIPYVIVADSAFPLSENLMKPYPQRDLNHDRRIFNYRLSRARRIIENSFGILANRFRILLTTINLNASKVEQIVLACVTLHNYLATENHGNYTNIDEEETICKLNPIGTQGGNKSTDNARLIREEFKLYFNSATGSVSWQEESITRNNL